MPLFDALKQVASQIESSAVRDETYQVLHTIQANQTPEGKIETGVVVGGLAVLLKLLTSSKS